MRDLPATPPARANRPGPTVRRRVHEVNAGGVSARGDVVATEEPLELRLSWPGDEPRSLVVTMRTPGADFELAAGFLHGEGIIRDADDLRTIAYCTDPGLTADQLYNVVTVELAAPPASAPTQRYGAATAACGVCGKQSLDDLELRGYQWLEAAFTVGREQLLALPDRLRDTQTVFARTGGLHAAGLFTPAGDLYCVREDIGRHNTVDKVVGWSVLQGIRAPDRVLVVSGRIGFEITQKALAAGIAVIAAVGAPSSLAVELAERFGMTLVGFVRDERFVVYTAPERIAT